MGVDPKPIFGLADFADPRFNIPEGMRQIPFIGPDLLGDINGDGQVNSADVQLVVNSALRRATTNLPTDLTGDTLTNAEDIQKVVNLSLGR